MNVLADDDENLRRYVDNGGAVLVCEYIDTESNVQNRIYYHFKATNSTSQIGPWAYVYRLSGNLNYLESFFVHKNRSLGQFFEVFGSGSLASYNLHNNRMPNSFENVFTCPAYVHADLDRQNEVCYSDDPTCGKNFEFGPFKLNTNAESIFKIIDDAALTYMTESTDLLEEWIYNKDFTQKVRSYIKSYIKSKYQLGTTYEFPAFIEHYLDNLPIDLTSSKTQEATEKAKDRVDAVIDKRIEQGTISEEEGAKLKKDLKDRELSDMYKSPIKGSYTVDVDRDSDCNGLLGPDMSKIVKNLFTFVQYLGPVLIAVFSIMDFIKASVAGDEGQLKKAGERLGKRIVCGILLFFVPLICSILLDFGGITLTDTCIEQYGSKETSE